MKTHSPSRNIVELVEVKIAKQFQQSKLLVVSDVHLHHLGDEKGVRLLRSLATIDPTVTEVVVFLGDIFDFCFGGSQYFQEKFRKLGEVLSQLVDGGTRVIFFHGNHEFFLARLGWRGVEFVSASDYVLSLREGPAIALTHGDFILAPWHYRLYMACVRSTLSRVIAGWVPQGVLDRLCLGLASHSRKQGEYKKVPHGALLSRAVAWVQRRGCAVGIMGHYHVPYDYRKEGVRILCSPAWDAPSFLSFDGQEFERINV